MELSFEPQEGDGAHLISVKNIIPDGIEIRDTRYGKGLFATAHFSKGQVLYRGHWVYIPNLPGPVVLRTQHSEFAMTVLTHSVLIHERNQRQLFGFDGFMNHSCEPNTYSANESSMDEPRGHYDTVALRDIVPGDEITCDYDLFEWDCEDKGIESCGCGTPSCRKRVVGFKYLSPESQSALLPFAYAEVRESYDNARRDD